ncbi:DUF4197 domain-containing protein [Marinoscillum pacificum]|uniref:DUF4197 domain-containing protein n=1 Tax=Marinoscillum pacificum TaxID=392723 RepID=UPI002157FE5B|nr:DUF4197 domain-containing protein [Marinoscillum pacificum]
MTVFNSLTSRLLILTLFLTLFSCDVLNSSLEDLDVDELTEAEVIEGLKEALVVGTDTSTNVLGSVNGYLQDEAVKILLPEEAQPIFDNMEKLGLTSIIQPLIDQTVESMNRAAEESAALDSTKVIFKDAITDMTIADGWAILNGADTSATTYLKDKTYTRLLSNFSAIISPVLNKPIISGIDLSTEELYSKLVSTYNTGVEVYNLTQLLNPANQLDQVQTGTLADHATGKALDGLFLKVSEEEKSIRKDPWARVTDILEKVFGSLDD